MSALWRCLVTCEHGGNRVPARYRHLFAGHEALLAGHRGYDPGALDVARDLARALQAGLFVATVSRLVVDLNRSPGHPKLYSELTRPADSAMRRDIYARCYRPYRERVETWIADVLAGGGRVLHVSSHSFTPVLDGVVRGTDIGLLYDPARDVELSICRDWQAALRARAPRLRVRRNDPYRGKSDGLTAWLRRRFPSAAYAGIELEINQKWVFQNGRAWHDLRRAVIETLPVPES